MARILIEPHERPLSGTVRVDGGKHAFAHSLACAALSESGQLTDVPDHIDARALRTALSLGYRQVVYDARSRVLTFEEPLRVPRIIIGSELARQSRSLFCLLPALLSRAEEVVLESAPQGCHIGVRPSDWYLKVLAQFGVQSHMTEAATVLSWPSRHAADVRFSYPTMTGTVIAIAAAAVSPGTSTIGNASVEPSCLEQLTCLRKMGGRVEGELPAVRIDGSAYEHIEWAIAPDRIHAVTYLTAGLLTRGAVTVTGSAPLRIPRFVEFLQRTGVEVSDSGDAISAAFPDAGSLLPVEIEAGSEPLFSSDWVPFASLLLAVRGSGVSTISDDVFLRRFQFMDILTARGLGGVRLSWASRRGREAVFAEVRPDMSRIRAGSLETCADIRGSAALVLAGLVADGPCVLEEDFHVRRGYTDLPGDLNALSGWPRIRTQEVSS